MRTFDYGQLLDLKLPVEIYSLTAEMYEYKGKQELYLANYPDVLDKMMDVAKI